MKRLWNFLFGGRKNKVSPSKRHASLYKLQYGFIPALVSKVALGDIPLMELTRLDVWEFTLPQLYGKDFFVEWNEMSCEKIELNENCHILFYTFPKPQRIPDAAFGAVLVNTKLNYIKYFTLEQSLKDNWVIGSVSPEKHYSFSFLSSPDSKEFLEWVKRMPEANA